MELRKTLGIAPNDSIEIFTEGESIVFKKYNPACYFCDNADDLVSFGGKHVCRGCIARLNQAADGR